MNGYYDHFKALVASRENNRRNYSWFLKPSCDWEFVNCQRHGHSYKRLPASAPLTQASCQDERVAGIVNDKWVSVPMGSEDYSFLKMRKNPYEDALFKCEDDRYELDMIIESSIATIRFLETVQEEIEALPDE
jgi:paired amphipathic helix protein Sin3a